MAMKRDRVGISERLLNKYYAKKYIQEPNADDDAIKHFQKHSGHCFVCHSPLIDKVYPLDEFTRNKIQSLPACISHAKELENLQWWMKIYIDKICDSCGVTFRSNKRKNYCSTSCEIFIKYHTKKIKKETSKCNHCGNEFQQKRRDSKFCNASCRAASWRNKKANG